MGKADFRSNLYTHPRHWDRLARQYARDLIFLNPGSAPSSGQVRLRWLNTNDRIYRYYVHLLMSTLARCRTQGARVLDVGCGRGGNSRIVAQYLDARSVVGLDFSAENIRFCRSHHRVRGLRFVRGDALDLPFPDGSFDVVVNIASSSMYRDRSTFYREVARVLRPGGTFCYSDALALGKATEYARAMEEAGLEVTASRDLSQDVIRGIRSNGENLKKLIFRPGACSDPIESAISVIYGANVVGLRKFSSGNIQFRSWKARKPR